MELVNKQNLDEYESFVSGHKKGHFMQSYMWAKVKDNWKWEALIVRDSKGEICGSMAVLIRKLPMLPFSIMYSPRGPVCDLHDKDTFEKLIDGARGLSKKYNSYVLKLDTDVKSSDEEYKKIAAGVGFKLSSDSKNFEGIQPRYVFRMNVENKTPDEMMASFHSKTRYNIRVAIKNNVSVRLGSFDDLDDFHKIMLETGVRDGFVIRSKGYFEKMMRALGEHCRLYMAEYEGKAVAGTLAVWYGDKVWYLYGASSNEYRNVMPNYLLQWEMIKWSLEKGCRIYDFRGVSGDLSEDNPLYGLYRFKKGFNGEFTEFVGEMDLAFNPVLNFGVNKGEKIFREVRKNLFLLKSRK